MCRTFSNKNADEFAQTAVFAAGDVMEFVHSNQAIVEGSGLQSLKRVPKSCVRAEEHIPSVPEKLLEGADFALVAARRAEVVFGRNVPIRKEPVANELSVGKRAGNRPFRYRNDCFLEA